MRRYGSPVIVLDLVKQSERFVYSMCLLSWLKFIELFFRCRIFHIFASSPNRSWCHPCTFHISFFLPLPWPLSKPWLRPTLLSPLSNTSPTLLPPFFLLPPSYSWLSFFPLTILLPPSSLLPSPFSFTLPYRCFSPLTILLLSLLLSLPIPLPLRPYSLALYPLLDGPGSLS